MEAMVPGPRRSACTCGRVHDPVAMQIIVQDGALERLPRVVRTLGQDRGVGLFDATTFQLFGDRVAAVFREAGVRFTPVVLGTANKAFEPNAAAVETALQALASESGAVLGVGTGAINDLGKYVAHRQGLPYISVPTAPSMDGFAAPISALLLNGVKTTFPTKRPEAVVGDLGIVAAAPSQLSAAGFGDIVGKLTSLRDWEMGHVLFGEYWCPVIADGVEREAAGLLGNVHNLAKRAPRAVEALLRALINTGVAVEHVGSSRPTSGSEHLISHFVEMWAANGGQRSPLHGHVVGFATLLVAEMAHQMRQLQSDDLPRHAPTTGASVSEILSLIRVERVPTNFGLQKFSQAVRQERLQRIRGHWQRLREVLAKIPAPESIASALTTMNCPIGFGRLGLDPGTAKAAITYARFLRERYTLLDVADDIGLLQDLAGELLRKYG